MRFFGWIILWQYASYEEELAKEELSNELLREEYTEKLGRIQDKIDMSTRELKERWRQNDVNHRPFIDNIFNESISIAGVLKDKPDWFESDIMGLYEYVAEILPGSYGILYYAYPDIDEDVFNVLVMKNGKLEHKLDPFLSPLFKNVDSY